MTATETPDLLDGLRHGEWLDQQVFPPLTWFVPGIIPEGMSLLVGGPKIGKSWLALDIALATAAGGRALSKINIDKPRPVLYLALEDGDRRLQDRCRKLLAGDAIPYNFQYMTRLHPGMIIPTIDAWLESLPGTIGEPLVILDTLGKVMPDSRLGESSYQRDYRVAGRLKQVCDDNTGMAILVLHHDRKAVTDDFVDAVSGTNGIAGAADTIIVLARKRTEDTGLLKITGRDVDENEYAVQTAGGVWSIIGNDLAAAAAKASEIGATVNLSDDHAKVVHLVGNQLAGTRAKDVVNLLGCTNDNARQILVRLEEAGRIRKLDRGLYGPVTSVTLSQPAEERDKRDACDTPLHLVPTPED